MDKRDDLFDVTEKAAKRIGLAVIVFWIISAIVSLVGLGVAIWAVIEIVKYVTGGN